MKHQHFLALALAQAEIRRGFCAPNPAVGAVVVKDEQVIAAGYHQQAGSPHAEVMALKDLALSDCQHATLYVTLEPCCHQGRTPACTDLILDKGVGRVVYGFADPNPQVRGGGEKALKSAGINCQQVRLQQIDEFYQSYAHWWKTKMPWVTAKLALSKDGKIAGASGVPVQITGPECQILTHWHRKTSDAILTTANTIIADNSQLNVRLPNQPIVSKPIYVLDSKLRIPVSAKIFSTAKSLTLLHQADIDTNKKTALEKAGANCVAIATNASGLDLQQALQMIANDGIHDLWVEAGARCFQALHKAGLVQTSIVYQGDRELGATAMSGFIGTPGWLVDNKQVTREYAGKDQILITGPTGRHNIARGEAPGL